MRVLCRVVFEELKDAHKSHKHDGSIYGNPMRF